MRYYYRADDFAAARQVLKFAKAIVQGGDSMGTHVNRLKLAGDQADRSTRL
jgi:hypothetical protein